MIHFAHGNGFPSLCYTQLLNALADDHECIYIDKIGHNNAYPINDNWQKLVDELLMSITLQAKEPVVAVGHSLGGCLSFLAACEAPELFKSVIMLDSPMLGLVKSLLIRTFKILGAIDHITPAHRTKNRKTHWASLDEVVSYLRSRALFKHFTDACLNDYIQYGLIASDKGYELSFNREIEYQIYRTIPHNLYKNRLPRSVPATLIYGTKSSVMSRFDLHYMQKKLGIAHYPIDGTHMFPMEYPEVTANMIKKITRNVK